MINVFELLKKRVKNYLRVRNTRHLFSKPQAFFVFFALLSGLIFVVINPPGFGLDERAHFMRTYLVSHGEMTPQLLQPQNEVGAYLPENLTQFVGTSTRDLLDNDTSRFFVNRQYMDREAYTQFFHERFSDEKINDPGANGQLLAANAYSPLGYVHMAVASRLAEVAGLPLMYSLYFARLANLILYVAVVFLAIKIIPKYKWVIAAVALLPPAIYQASSLSLDPLVTALSFLAVAYAAKFWFGPRGQIGNRELVIVSAIFVAIALIKTPYVCIALLFVFLPSNRFKMVKYSYYWKVVLSTATFLAALAWVYANRLVTPSLVLLQPGHANVSEQIQYILHNPVKVLATIARTHYEAIDHTLSSLLARVSDRQVGMPNAIVYILFVLSSGLVALFHYKKDNKDALLSGDESKYLNILLGLVPLAVIMLVSLTLYVTFTPVGATVAQGIQGRYFLPILPLVLIFLSRISPFKVVGEQNTALSVARLSSLALLSLTMVVFYVINF